MRISDVFTTGGDFGHGYGGYGSYGGYSGYACYGDYNWYCFHGSRPFKAPIQVKAPDLYGKDGKGAY